ncbi:prepilin-type N-terminal cleavage/methylation domain-containing protein [Undibacterium sp.]|uniref:prepilin-type N-terminal cleavage/methylation domain-containing protein n=1 Tax=Undibacterium sp. TaxID=1914977 RepID=UPI0037522FE5
MCTFRRQHDAHQMAVASTKQLSSVARMRGVTLIELLISIMIITVAVVGILEVFSLTTKISADPQLRKQAISIAESLLEEVQLASFTFCDPTDPIADTAPTAATCAKPELAGQEAGGVARPYDNVSDYVATFGTPLVYATDAAGGALPAGYTATVTINPDANLGPAGSPITPADGTALNMNVLRITVTVSYLNGAESVVIDGYRTRYAPTSLP